MSWSLRTMKSTALTKGAVINYSVPGGTRLHRIVEVTEHGYRTSGDANRLQIPTWSRPRGCSAADSSWSPSRAPTPLVGPAPMAAAAAHRPLLAGCSYVSRTAWVEPGPADMEMTPETTGLGKPSSDVAAEAEAALRTVRIILGTVACFVLVGYEPIADRPPGCWWRAPWRASSPPSSGSMPSAAGSLSVPAGSCSPRCSTSSPSLRWQWGSTVRWVRPAGHSSCCRW